MTPEQKKIETAIHEWNVLGFTREEIIDVVAGETGFSKDAVTVVYDKRYPAESTRVKSEPQNAEDIEQTGDEEASDLYDFDPHKLLQDTDRAEIEAQIKADPLPTVPAAIHEAVSNDDVAVAYNQLFPAVASVQPTPEAIRFINKHFEPDDVICVVLIDKKTGNTRNLFTKPSRIDDEFIESLHKENQTQNIYLGMNAYSPSLLGEQKIAEINRHGRTEDNVVAVRNLYADADHDGAAVLEKIKASTVVPGNISTVLESSPGKFNIIWRVGNVSKDEAKPIVKAVAQTFNTDPNVTDLARILRIPGFRNIKYEERPVVKMASESDGKYSRADFKVEIAPEAKPEAKPAAANWEQELQTQLAGPDIIQSNPGRNKTLTSILGRFRQVYRLESAQLLDIGLNINDRRCKPPLPESEVKTIAKSVGRYEVNDNTPIPVILGGQVLGQQPAVASIQVDLPKFVSVGQLEQGEVQMLIDGFLPEGTTFIGGLPGEGKTFFALSVARALTTGKPFLNAFNVPKTIPVIYLIPESGGRAFRKRCEKFEIPDDPELFLCRTVSQGATLPLDDAALLQVVARLKPVVILDTIIRFSESEDENAAAQNKKLVDDVIRLRQAGAVAVIGLHHAVKAMREKGMSLELALRGTGDIAATADAVYGLLRDNMLYNNGSGPNEIQVACLKPRDFEPPEPFRIAASRKVSGSDIPNDAKIRIVSSTKSIIDQQHDFQLVSRITHANQVTDRIEKLVLETPTVTLKELNEVTGISVWEIRRTLERLGYHRGRGGKKGATHWTKEPEKVEPRRADVDLNAVAA